MTLSDHIKPAVLTPEEQRKWESTASMLMWQAPGFSHYYGQMLCHTQDRAPIFVDDKAVCDRAWTDGVNIVANREFFFKMKLSERVFVIAHEIGHNMFNDPLLWGGYRGGNSVPMTDGSTKEFEEDCMQTSGDYRLNAMLQESGIGRPPADCCLDKNICDGTASVLDVYGSRYKKKPKPTGTPDPEDTPGQGQNDVNAPGASTQVPGPQAVNSSKQQVVMQQAMYLQKSQGKLPSSMERMFQNVLDPQISWIDQIDALISRKLGSDGRSWREPDQMHIGRDLYLPARSGHGAGHLTIWGDTSGSRNESDIADDIAELAGIMEELNPERLTVVWGDAEVANVQEFEDASDLADCKPQGGGGTDIDPVIQWVNDQPTPPDMLIAFTDGYLTFPEHAPPYPVLWVIDNDAITPPWGDLVRRPKRKQEDY